MSLQKHGTAYTKPATTLEIVFRCLGVALFLVFIFVIVPKLGPTGIQHCKTAVNSNFETLEDLQTFLQLLAEELHAHDAEKAKHLLSLAQQIGGSSISTAGNTAGHVSTDAAAAAAAAPAVPGTGQLSVGSVTGTAAATGSVQQQQQQQGTLLQQLQRSQADLTAARKVIQKHEELLQKQLQEAAALKAQLQQQQQPQQQQQQQQAPGLPAAQAGTAAGTTAAAGGGAGGVGDTWDAAAVHALAMTGNACGVLPGVEWGGDVVIWGAEHKIATAAECCAACLAHAHAIARGVGSDKGKDAQPCNAWVYCSDAKSCGHRFQECWLKHDAQLTDTAAAAAAAAAAGSSGGSMWTSGVPAAGQPVTAWQLQQLTLPSSALAVLSGAPAVQDAVEAAGVGSLSGLTAATAPVLVWETHLGVIRVQLLPELAPGSVRQLIRMGALLAVTSNGRCSNCRIYRAEPGFLVQGIVEAPGAYVAVPRHPNPPQRKVMQRGLVCWAGGGGGPDWFVNMIDQSGFGDDHLCFGQVDEAGLAVFERILQLPVKPKGGAESVEMVLLQQEVRFTFTLDKAQHGV